MLIQYICSDMVILKIVCFLQYKSDLYTRDHEGLGPLDIVMKDRALQTGLPPAG